MRVGKIGVVIIGLVPFNVYGEPCTPAPDCASIGYTENSCEGDSLKCPFDTSKLKCMPCDSSFRYDCSGDNITSGIGSICGGKYVSCECVTNYFFVEGACICPDITISDCLVGAIYYPDGNCSNEYVTCKNPIGVVVKDNALVMSWRKNSDMMWASNNSTDTLTTKYSDAESAQLDYDGKSNTLAIIEAYFDDTVDNNAAIYCNEYTPRGMESTKGQWYLPAAGELYHYVYGNYNTLLKIYTTSLRYSSFTYWFWSSSERAIDGAWSVLANEGRMSYYYGKVANRYSVSCFLDIR